MFYSDGPRRLQDRFDSRRLADRLEERAGEPVFTPDRAAFVEARDCFFLATADAHGHPQCSYKGGEPGFVRVTGPSELTFPAYDGNGMFLSLGNVLENPWVGLLFIDFYAQRPSRLRVNGTASIVDDPAVLELWPGAVLAVRVTATEIFPNCPRYIHRMELVERGRFVPVAGVEPPVPEWKKTDWARDILPQSWTKTDLSSR